MLNRKGEYGPFMITGVLAGFVLSIYLFSEHTGDVLGYIDSFDPEGESVVTPLAKIISFYGMYAVPVVAAATAGLALDRKLGTVR